VFHASLIKRIDGKQVKPGEQLPKGYNQLNTAQHNTVVTGPYASSNLAVVCQSEDLQSIGKHALLRRKQLDAR